MQRIRVTAIAIVVLICVTARAHRDEPSSATAERGPTRFFLIGNSLTWDTVPSRLDGDTQWHVDCGKSLPFMVANPEKPCVASSTLWPTALKETRYDVLAIQVHYGSTLAEDVAAISTLIALQPQASVIIHTGWARSASRTDEWESTDGSESATMSHNLAWFDALLGTLREKYPQREFRRTRAMDMLQLAGQDIAAEHAPIEEAEALYRDKIHMNVATGRYLMHNAMRHALGQPRSAAGFEKLDPKLKVWLDSLLDRVLQD